MSGDLIQIGVGLFFLSWFVWFPGWLARLRQRSADAGGLATFDRRSKPLALLGRYGVPGLGAILVLSGVVFLIADA
jgi:hypothetical protein